MDLRDRLKPEAPSIEERINILQSALETQHSINAGLIENLRLLRERVDRLENPSVIINPRFNN